MTESKNWKPLALTLALGLLGVATRLLPTEYRPFNFAAIGAVAMFAAARIGLWPSLVISAPYISGRRSRNTPQLRRRSRT